MPLSDYRQMNRKTMLGVESKDRVIINVGGCRHECYLSTIQNFPDTRLYWIAETVQEMVDFDPETNIFFFDRHPGCFQNILNYCRTGKLHCPNDVCGPLFEQELAFWGVDELQMEPCCWGTYSQHRGAHKHLKMFEKGSEDRYDEEARPLPDMDVKRANKCLQYMKYVRPIIWTLLEEPNSSLLAKVTLIVNILQI